MGAPAAYSRRSYSGGGYPTTIAGGLTATASSCSPANTTNWPSGSGGPFSVVIDRSTAAEEKAWCSSLVDGVLTFQQRGADGSTAYAHNPGCTIALCTTAQDADEANQTANQTLGIVEAVGDLLICGSIGPPNTFTRVVAGSQGQVLQMGGSSLPFYEDLFTVAAEASSFTAKYWYFYECGGVTATLPTPRSGAVIGFNGAVNTSTVINASGSAKIFGPGVAVGGVTSISIEGTYSFVLLMCDSSNWYVIGGQQDSGWVAVSGGVGYTNSWATYSSFQAAAYRLTGNSVELRGIIAGGSSGSSAFTLPVGYRPAVTKTLSAWAATSAIAGGNMPMVTITTAGLVEPLYDGTLTDFSLDGIRFTVD